MAKIFSDKLLLLFVLSVINGCAILEGEQGKEYRTVLYQPIRSETKQFENENFCINFFPSNKLISFTLQNKTQLPIKIVWDEVIFTNPEGETYRVLNSRVRYKSHGKVSDPAHHFVAPTEVSPGQTYSDYIRPFYTGVRDKLIYPVKDARGSRFKVMLPLEVKGHVNIYTFAFEII